MTRILAVLCTLAAMALGGPVEFGTAEVERAIAESKRDPRLFRITTEVTGDPPGSFKIIPMRRGPCMVTGGDLRGVMYGLLEAAEQIRDQGRLSHVEGAPAVGIRGVRLVLEDARLERSWPQQFWRNIFSTLARNRFNRFHLVFAQPAPYRYWVDVREFPGARIAGLNAASRQQNLAMLGSIAQAAVEFGLDFTLGIRESEGRRIEGLGRDDIAAYSHAALGQVLAAAKSVRAVELHSDATGDVQTELWEIRAIREAGRLVRLELSGAPPAGTLLEAAREAGVPVRVSREFWPGGFGRPYQPAEAGPSRGYMNLLAKPHPFEILWEVRASDAGRPLLWGDPDYVRRAVHAFTLGASNGFEIDVPLEPEQFHRFWFDLLLWGRLSYNPAAPEAIWRREFNSRFGAAGASALEAYQAASTVLPEVGAGADTRTVASISEAVRNRIERVASAKETPVERSEYLAGLAARIRAALDAVKTRLPENAEWRMSEPDFEALRSIALFHSNKLAGRYQLELFAHTGDPAALAAARHALDAAAGNWHDGELDAARERVGLFEQYGPFDSGFEFGGPTPRTAGGLTPVTAATAYSEKTGFGWLPDASRVFRLRSGDGEFTLSLVHPDSSADRRTARADSGLIDIAIPEDVSVLLVSSRLTERLPALVVRPPRPVLAHTPPPTVPAGQPLKLALRIGTPAAAKSVRLYYRPVNQTAKFKILEEASAAQIAFVIPGADLSPRWDLMYYFEVLNSQGTGWFLPDPRTATPYYSIPVEEKESK